MLICILVFVCLLSRLCFDVLDLQVIAVMLQTQMEVNWFSFSSNNFSS